MTWFKSSGKLIYDPVRPKNLKRGTDYWAILTVDKEITRYLRYWLNRKFNLMGLKNHGVFVPAFDGHISVIRGVKDMRHSPEKVKKFWRYRHGEVFEFEYDINIRRAARDHNVFWISEVHCPELINIRKMMGLKVNYKLHITVAKENPS